MVLKFTTYGHFTECVTSISGFSIGESCHFFTSIFMVCTLYSPIGQTACSDPHHTARRNIVQGKPRIAVIGAGLGGTVAAALLQRAGYQVRLYEQAPAFSRLGAGI